MRIGLDMANHASNRSVELIALATNDTDCIPAMKYARRAGLQVALVCLPNCSPARNCWGTVTSCARSRGPEVSQSRRQHRSKAAPRTRTPAGADAKRPDAAWPATPSPGSSAPASSFAACSDGASSRPRPEPTRDVMRHRHHVQPRHRRRGPSGCAVRRCRGRVPCRGRLEREHERDASGQAERSLRTAANSTRPDASSVSNSAGRS